MKSHYAISSNPKKDLFFQAWARALTVVSVFLFMAGAGLASLPEDGDLPEAEAVLDNYVKATGGMEAYEKIENRITESTIELVGQGLKFELVVKSAKPDLMYSITKSDMMGNSERGYDGKVVWENTTMQGPVIKEGIEKDSFIMISLFDRTVYWKQAFAKAECTGMEEVDGKPCYKLVMTPKTSGPAREGEADDKETPKPMTWYFDKESHLLVRLDMSMVGPMGNMEIESFLGDYREVDGVLLPYSTSLKMMGQERMKTVVTSVKQNVDLTKDAFAAPEDIQALLKEDSSEKEG